MTETYVKRTRIAAPAAKVFAFHERPDALRLLSPPWQHVTIVRGPRSLAVGTRVVLRVGPWPLRQTVRAEHIAYEPGRSFTDRMQSGPFKSWVHHHLVVPDGAAASYLIDEVEYVLPLGILGKVVGGPIARAQIERLFAFRHEVTRAACEGEEG